MHCLQTLVLAGLPFAALAARQRALPKRAATDPFQLYAYGTGIGGLNLFSTGDATYIGSADSFNSSSAAPVIFTPSSTTWTATANSSTVPWSNSSYTFAVPAPTTDTREVKVVQNDTASGYLTSGFNFYGHVVIFEAADGTWETQWYATPSEVDGVYQLNWNSSGEASTEQVLVTLKDTVPSK